MSWLTTILALFALALVASYVIEIRRKAPKTPLELDWAPGAEIRFLTIDGVRLRCLKSGVGRPVLLLHTLRTQLDLFRDVVPDLDADFEVHTFDYPGHGYSEIPAGPYDPELFARSVRGFLQLRDLQDVVIVGESIGGALGLLMAAEGNARVAKIVAINSYDYDRGRGILRGSWFSALVFRVTLIPVLGPMVWRLRWFGAFATIIKGSVHNTAALPPDLVREMSEVGNRPGHYRAFISLIENFPKWELLRRRYPSIRVPVTLVYGAHDWSRPDERQTCRDLIEGAALEIVPDAGHLMSLDAPEATIRFARAAAEP